MDILLNKNNDIQFSDGNDFVLFENSTFQDVRNRLQWFLGEWRFAPELGVPYFENVFVKKPNKNIVAQIIKEEAKKADNVIDVRVSEVKLDIHKRTADISLTIITNEQTYREDLEINV